MSISVKNYSNRASYDGVTPNENEIIVPWVLTPEMEKLLFQQGFKSYQVETHHMPNGKSIKVFFMRIPAENYACHMKAYNEEINLYLTDERNAKSHYERKISEETQQPVLSLDKIFEDLDNDDVKGIDPTGSNINEENAKALSLFGELVGTVGNEKDCKIIKMLWEGRTKKYICKTVLPEKSKTQAYAYIEKLLIKIRAILDDMAD